MRSVRITGAHQAWFNGTSKILATSAFDEVMWRVHLMPMTGTGSSRLDPRIPKYLAEFTNDYWQLVDYGSQDVCLVALNASNTVHTTLGGNSDVYTFPEDMSGNPTGGGVAQLNDAFESLSIPGNWINASFSYGTILRRIIGMFILNQRYWVIRGNTAGNGRHSILDAGLNATVDQVGSVTDLNSAASSLGLDSSGVTGSTLIREMLRIFAAQFDTRPYTFDPGFIV